MKHFLLLAGLLFAVSSVSALPSKPQSPYRHFNFSIFAGPSWTFDAGSNQQIQVNTGVGNTPFGVAITPDGSKVYVANIRDHTVSVINTTTNTVSSTISVGLFPSGVAVTPDGSKVYVANEIGSTVSVINTATDTVTATLSGLGGTPESFGNFIG